MAARTRSASLVSMLIIGLALMLQAAVNGQTFMTLYGFSPFHDYGYEIQAGLVLAGNTLYGTALFGGASGCGTVFAINTDGSGLTNLHNFNGDDGGFPEASLILSGNMLYGTTEGVNGSLGTVFALTTNGTFFTNLYSFTGGSDGGTPRAALILSDGTLYGTTPGTIFSITTNGTEFTTLYDFVGSVDSQCGGLVISGNTLYGTEGVGGTSDSGTVFAFDTVSLQFTNFYNFTNGTDEGSPDAGLVLTGSTLYGTTTGGEPNGGTVFAINTNGTAMTNLHVFSGGDGGYPMDSLLLANNTLYGTTHWGGESNNGTVFSVNIDGTGFKSLYSFTGGSDNGLPVGGLVLSGNTLYGTTSYPFGTVFSLTLPAPLQLTVAASGTNITLAWPTNATGMAVQSTTNLGLPAAWSVVSGEPVVINGQNTVTDVITGPQKFYRLSR